MLLNTLVLHARAHTHTHTHTHTQDVIFIQAHSCTAPVIKVREPDYLLLIERGVVPQRPMG